MLESSILWNPATAPCRCHKAMGTQSQEFPAICQGEPHPRWHRLRPSLLRYLQACSGLRWAFRPSIRLKRLFLAFHWILRTTILLGDFCFSLWLLFINTIWIDVKFAIWWKGEKKSFCSYHVPDTQPSSLHVLNYLLLITTNEVNYLYYHYQYFTNGETEKRGIW